MTVADRHAFANAFAALRPIEVPAPELGEDVVVRFRRTFTANDLSMVLGIESWREPLVLDVVLARLALVDENGKPLVDLDNDKWFLEGADGVLIARLSRRAGLKEQFLKSFKRTVDTPEDDKKLDKADIQQMIAEFSLQMRLSPDEIRAWPVQDLMDVLRAATKRDDSDADVGDEG